MKLFKIVSSIFFTLATMASAVANNTEVKNEWVTLGTMGGPMPNATHSQPANALIVGEHAYAIDAGDGLVGQFTASGGNIARIKAVFISHLHFDHTGGLPALIALRWQTSAKYPLTIYGPPGIKETVEGIFSFMSKGAEGHYGVVGQIPHALNKNIEVVELTHGAKVDLADFTLTAIRNSHFSWPKGSDEWNKYQSFSYKFELANRTIVYTGDTGPSDAVIELAKNADLYVSEMMDITYTVNKVRKINPNMPKQALIGMEKHLRNHHVTPEQVGDMAKRAGVKKLVITHMVPALDTQEEIERYKNKVQAIYKGEIAIAKDLDRF